MANYISTDPNAGLEKQNQYLSTDPNFGLEPTTPSVAEIAQHAGTAAVETAKGFIPKSLGEVLGFVTPVVGAVQDVGREYGTLKDILFGKPIAEATAQNFPETQILPQAEKTAPFSEERFQAGFGTLAQLGMAAAVGRSLTPKQVGLTEPLASTENLPSVETVNKSLEGGELNAEQIISPTQVHGDVLNVPGTEESTGQMPTNVGSEGVQTRGQGEIVQQTPQEVAPTVPQPEQSTPVSEAEAVTTVAPLTQTEISEATPKGQAEPTIPPTIGKDVTKDIPDFPQGKETGLTQDFISKDREARGEAPLAKQARQTNPEIWDRSSQQFQSNPNIGHELVSDLMENPRPLQEGDAGVLLRHRVNLSNETDLQYQKLTNPDSSPVQKGEALSQLSALRDARNDADTVLQNSSSTMGRSFQFLKSLSAEDYSLSGISQQRRAAMAGKELTPSQEEAFTKENAQWSKDILEKDKALQDYQKTQTQQESALKSYKTRLKTAATEYERKLAFSDYEQQSRNAMKIDPEAQRLKGELEAIKFKFQKQLIKDQIQNFPWWKKVLNGTAWVARESALSGYHILAKLASFTGSRLAEIPLTETAERGWAMIPGFRDIAAHSEFGAGANAQALGELYTKFATDGMRQAVQQMKSGVSEVRAAYGKEKLGLSYPSFFGNLHAVEKTPLLVGSQAMNRVKLMNKALSDVSSRAISEGLDVTDPIVQSGINKKAFDAATYDILQEQSGLADAIRGRLSQMEGIQKKTGEYSIEGNILSALIKTFVTKDILRTPLNYVKQTFERTPLGLTRGLVRGGRSVYKGVENVKPTENAAIMKLLGVGSVGTGMFVWGAIDAIKPPNQRVFGGYYQPGEKRDSDDVKFATLRPFGVNIPHYLSHFPAVESAQMGNTMMRVALSSLSKKDRTNKGLVSGIVASTLGLAYQAPIAAQVPRLGKLQDQRTQATALGDVISGLVPSLVRDIATDTDKAESRKATTTLQSVESVIPGLREQVPEGTEKQSKNRPR